MDSDIDTRADLLEKIRDGADPATWNEFFNRYWRFVFTVARQHGCTEHTAEEVVQEVMTAIFEQRAVFRHDPARGRFRDWLGGVARNKTIVRHREAAKQPRAKGGDRNRFPDIEDQAEAAEIRWEAVFEQSLLTYLLDRVRREVNPRTYQAFEAFTFGGCSGAEAARLTGLSRNAVYQARKNILRRLRQLGADLERRSITFESGQEAFPCQTGTSVERSMISWNVGGERIS